MPKTTKKFDKAAYDLDFQREHYSKLTGVFTKDEAVNVKAAAKAAGLTLSVYIKQAVMEKMERDDTL